MEERNKSDQKIIDLGKVFHALWAKKKLFFKVWLVTFILSCVWILPTSLRWYNSEVVAESIHRKG